jgi:hypothetical protein
MKRVEAASGAKYSTHNERVRKVEPIAPTGTSYTPVGRPDIAAMRKAPAAQAPSAPPKPAGAAAPVRSAASFLTKPAVAKGPAPTDAWPEDEPKAAAPPPPPPVAAAPPPPPAASRPVPSAPRVVPSVRNQIHATCCSLLISRRSRSLSLLRIHQASRLRMTVSRPLARPIRP